MDNSLSWNDICVNCLEYMKKYFSAITILGVLVTSAWAQKADLKHVSEQLDMDGSFYMANNIEGDLSKLARLGNDWLETARKNGSKSVEESADFQKAMEVMGLDHLVAYGRSAKHHGDHWVNKMYWQTGGTNEGIFSMLGDKASGPVVPTFAPEGTDLVVEMNMDMRQMTKVMKTLAPMCKDKEKCMTGWMEQPLNQNMKFGELVDQLNMKMSLAVKLDDKKRKSCPVYPEYTFPEMHACVRMDGAMVVWKQFAPMAGFMFKIEKQEDGTKMYTPLRKHKRWGDKQPIMLVNEERELIWMATSKEFLAACRGEGKKLLDDPQYQAISRETEGGVNAMAYLSRQACLEIRQVKEVKYKKKQPVFSEEYMKFMLDHVTESKNGYFAAVSKTEKGMNFVVKTPCPIKEMFNCGKGCCKWKSRCKSSKSCGNKKSKCTKTNNRKTSKCPLGH